MRVAARFCLGCPTDIVLPVSLPAGCQLFAFSCVTLHSGAGAHWDRPGKGEPSDNLCSQRAEDGHPCPGAGWQRYSCQGKNKYPGLSRCVRLGADTNPHQPHPSTQRAGQLVFSPSARATKSRFTVVWAPSC